MPVNRLFEVVGDTSGEYAKTLQFLSVAQLFFELFALRNVAADMGSANNASALIAYRRNSERDLDQLTIFSASHRLEVVYLFPTSDAL